MISAGCPARPSSSWIDIRNIIGICRKDDLPAIGQHQRVADLLFHAAGTLVKTIYLSSIGKPGNESQAVQRVVKRKTPADHIPGTTAPAAAVPVTRPF